MKPFALRLLVSSALLLSALPALAAQRAFVSTAFGNDANTASNCSSSAPCRTFAAGITVVDPNGELIALDSGAYGPVTVTKSIAIIAPPGVYGGMTIFSGNGVTIATAGVNVSLRGLTINGMGGTYGVHMTDGASLSVENCVIANFSDSDRAGIKVDAPAAVAVTGSQFRNNYTGLSIGNGAAASVADSYFLKNGTGVGVWAPYGTTTTANVERTVITRGSIGIASGTLGATAVARLVVSDSVVSDHAWGVKVTTVPANFGGGSPQVFLTNSRLFKNTQAGLEVSGTGTKATLSGNTITHNYFGIYLVGGVVESSGDNVVRANSYADVTGTLSTITKM